MLVLLMLEPMLALMLGGMLV